MIQLFQGLLPSIRLPVHQTLQRQLYRLFDVLVLKVKDSLKGIERHAISTDAWSSKNSVYSLAGIILFFIDKNWTLNELVLDVIDLDAEHAGSLMGKLVYSALRAKGAAHQAIACVTDNASTNSLMNKTLAAQIRKHEGVHAHSKSMSFTCIAHAIHLVCTDLTSHLGVIESDDHYSEVKGSNLEEYIDDEDDGMDPGLDLDFDTESESNFDEDLLEELAPELASADDEKPTGRASKGGRPKALTIIEKIHEIVVYATASPKRQKEMRQIINKTCPKDVRHLFLKKSMRIRWDSVRAELKRALQLRQAITYFVANLDSAQSRRGKSRKMIQKMQIRWNITGEEWDLGTMVVEILDPFHTASEAMSRRDAATLADVIPTFALLERKLLDNISQLRNITADRGNATARALLSGLDAALVKLQKYQTLAHENELCIIATVLNPRFRLKYLTRWPELHSNASTVVSNIFENYRVKYSKATNTLANSVPHQNPQKSSKTGSAWEAELYSDVPLFVEQFDQELK
ncbi:unnamed protein product [Rhizoctonia solani]|uniref:AC transposase n=2 Tax=Rhizoctonia solani TaxID=456999 RepID=A0A8H3D9F3_9AGAM